MDRRTMPFSEVGKESVRRLITRWIRVRRAAPSASWACSARCPERGERPGRALVAGTCVSGLQSVEVRGRMLAYRPWILRNCSTFGAALCIRVSLDTMRVKFASVIMNEDGDSVESTDTVTVERRRNSEVAP